MGKSFAERLGRKIAAARTKAKLTMTEAAAEAGIAYNRWHEYETGLREPGAERLFAIAKALRVTPGELEP
jgi:transcriptional regulator with XRE-family HTH domain